MLLELSINNFAIIEDLNIQFTKGLNLLTGETGSGKSIIIDALGIILGGRGTKDLIRSGAKKATLQAVFLVESFYRIQSVLDEYGIDIEDDGLLIISREVMHKGPSISRINGKTVTLTILNKISSTLVDIFAQQEHQSLLNIGNHRTLIDSFGDEKFLELKLQIKSNYDIYIKEKKLLENMNMDVSQRNREIDLLKFQIDEIDTANLGENEDHLENEYSRLSNIKSISMGLSKVTDSLSNYNYSNNNSVLDIMHSCISILKDLTEYDLSLKAYLNRLESTYIELKDINNDLIDYLNSTEVNEEKLYYLEERIDLLNKLKRKYGNTIEEILEYRSSIGLDLNRLLNYSEEIEKKQENIMKLEKILLKQSKELSSLRKTIGMELEGRISEELSTLNMENILFKVNFKENYNLGPEGIDQIEFLISTNPGEDLKSLSKIVSGGEMSRIMLGFKSIFAEHDRIPTLIFDEIDTGISGRTAQIVGEKIYKIAKRHQVISISHLPQIAALADSHYMISKEINEDNKMITNIKKLSENQRIEELARLLGGVNVTNTTLNHAKEMLEMSKRI